MDMTYLSSIPLSKTPKRKNGYSQVSFLGAHQQECRGAILRPHNQTVNSCKSLLGGSFLAQSFHIFVQQTQKRS